MLQCIACKETFADVWPTHVPRNEWQTPTCPNCGDSWYKEVQDVPTPVHDEPQAPPLKLHTTPSSDGVGAEASIDWDVYIETMLKLEAITPPLDVRQIKARALDMARRAAKGMPYSIQVAVQMARSRMPFAEKVTTYSQGEMETFHEDERQPPNTNEGVCIDYMNVLEVYELLWQDEKYTVYEAVEAAYDVGPSPILVSPPEKLRLQERMRRLVRRVRQLVYVQEVQAQRMRGTPKRAQLK